jgi:hypothetical protein
MSSEEAVHVSLMEVTPTSGKGTLGTWWFLRQARAWLDKTEHINRSQGQGRSYEQTLRRRGVCAPALEPRDEGEGSWTKCQGFKPDLRNSAVRHYRGGLVKRSHGGIVNPPCNRKGKNGNPSPIRWRARGLSQRSSRQGCESCEMKVLVPPIACCRADSMSDACEGNDARSARM